MLNEICEALKARSEDRLIERKYKFFQAYKGGYGEGDHFLGVDNPNVREVANEFQSQANFKIIKKLLHSKYHEVRFAGLIIMERQFDKACKNRTLDKEKQERIYKLYIDEINAINNWDLVDLSAPHILGRYLLDKSDRSILYCLADTGELWKERISILSTLAFIRNKDFKDTLKLASKFLHHNHDLMHKAVGWMLREIGKKDFETEVEFLKKNKYNTIPRTTLRYSIEKFPEVIRQQYLKGEA